MKKNNDKIVSFTTARKLKKCDFDLETVHYYVNNGEIITLRKDIIPIDHNISFYNNIRLSAPNMWDVMSWLRNYHNFHIYMEPNKDLKTYNCYCRYEEMTPHNNINPLVIGSKDYTYEQILDKGISCALDFIYKRLTTSNYKLLATNWDKIKLNLHTKKVLRERGYIKVIDVFNCNRKRFAKKINDDNVINSLIKFFNDNKLKW